MEKTKKKLTYEEKEKKELFLFPKWINQKSEVKKAEKARTRKSMIKCFKFLKGKGHFKNIKSYEVWEKLKQNV